MNFSKDVYEFNQKMRTRRSNEELRAIIERRIIKDYDNLCKLDIPTLRELARSRGISGYSEMCKEELIHQLNTVTRYIYQPTPGSVPRDVTVVRDGRFL